MRLGALILILAALGPLTGCASTSSATPGDTATGAAAHSASSPRRRDAGRHRHGPRRAAQRSSAALAVSSASGHVVQAQPPPGSCHARGHGPYAMPDPHCTPGAVNPAVTQAMIDRTICASGWTTTVRPPESITEREKQLSMTAYGDTAAPGDYEYDHLVSLELGGAVNDARNLWPEPAASPNAKDSVEDRLHRLVCDGQMRLARAQQIIATGWAAWARRHPGGATAPGRSAPGGAPPRPAPPARGSSGPDKPISGINCSDFPTHAAAQQWFEAHGGSPTNDVAGLDRNHDGQACTSLP